MLTLKPNQVRSLQIVHGGPQTTFRSPATWRYTLTQNYLAQDGDQVALKYMAVYYSWRNVTAAIGNNTFGYYWNVAGVATLFTLVLQDGIYQFTDISAALELFQYNNGHYLLDSNGNPVYYLTLTLNPTLYCLSLVCTPVPSPLPDGYTNPNGLTLGGIGPQLNVPAGFTALSGFAEGVFPPATQTTLYEVNSTSAPQIRQQSTINITCNLANSTGFANGSNVIYSFNANDKTAGQLIKIEPNFRDWHLIAASGNYTYIEVSFTDQLGNPVLLYDPAGFAITLNLGNGTLN